MPSLVTGFLLPVVGVLSKVNAFCFFAISARMASYSALASDVDSFSPIFAKMVAEKFGSSPKALDNSFSVSNASGAPFTRAFTTE